MTLNALSTSSNNYLILSSNNLAGHNDSDGICVFAENVFKKDN